VASRTPSVSQILPLTPISPSAACDLALRYPECVATMLNREKLHDVLDQAVIVIDAEELERSRQDPRVLAFHQSADRLLSELEAEGAEYS
jgi:hypothetical protein